MTRELRWRIIALQVVMVVVLVAGAAMSFWGSNFTNEQISGQLAPQKIFFPKDVSTVPEPEKSALQPYLGQQVLNGEQAHIFAENYLGLHLRELADGKVYSELSTEARLEKDPALKAKKDGLVQTAFRGETLRSMLNQAWAFSIFGTVALYAGFGLGAVALIVLGALVFELFFAKKPIEVKATSPSFTTAPTRA
ncbi:MAG TPA: hypothetical protein VJ183_01730 [Chloroflexia bacterium]|nr:hypothetical protein [Chloroflexia bacterium]